MSPIIGSAEARTIVCLLLLCLVWGCNISAEEPIVRRDFENEHPTYKIISIGLPDGRGDSTVVTYFIRYKKPGDNREFWSDWAYETKNGKPELVGKGSENIYNANP